MKDKKTQENLNELSDWQEKIIKEEGERIRKEYGAITERDILLAKEAEKEKKQCEDCQGMPCKKEGGFKGLIPKAEMKEIGNQPSMYITYFYCKYEKARRNQVKTERNIKNALIPKQYENLSFEDYQLKEENVDATMKAKKCLDTLEGLYIYGKPGIGKTMLASIIANESLKRQRSVIFSKVSDLLRNIRATYRKDSEQTELDVLSKLYDCDVLIIDDMRPERSRKFASETLFDVIDARYSAKKQTIITSNGTLEEVCSALNRPLDAEESIDGTRIYDRCKEMLKMAHIKGESKRGL